MLTSHALDTVEAETRASGAVVAAANVDSQLYTMIRQVQEVLPHVPEHIIRNDLGRLLKLL